MRAAEKPATLGELMGDDGSNAKPTLENLPDILGEKMPEMPYDRVGKIRLIHALQQRFGPGYMNIPGVSDIVNQFDSEIATASTVKMNRRK